MSEFLRRTSDLQTAAIFSGIFSLRLTELSLIEELQNKEDSLFFIKCYEQFLNKLELWELKAEFRIALNDLNKILDNVLPKNCQDIQNKKKYLGPEFQCITCGNLIEKNPQDELTINLLEIQDQNEMKLLKDTSICKCETHVSNCSICLLPFLRNENTRNLNISSWIVICTKCRHGGHLNHLRPW